MIVHVHYRNAPEIDEICNAQPAELDTEDFPEGTLYVTGEHFGTIMRPDQEGPDSTFPMWYEVIGCDARPGGKHTSPHVGCVLR